MPDDNNVAAAAPVEGTVAQAPVSAPTQEQTPTQAPVQEAPAPQAQAPAPQTQEQTAPTQVQAEQKAQSQQAAPKSLLEEQKTVDPLDEKIADWATFKPQIPEGYNISQEALDSFGEMAVATGLTARQAQAAIDWQLKEIQARQQALYEVGKEELQKEWGPRVTQNVKAVIGIISKVDRLLGDNSFSKGINDSGAGLNPAVIRGLYKLSELISEDSLGKNESAAPEQVEDALQGITRQLREQIASRK